MHNTQVKPGGSSKVNQNGSATLERADAGIDSEVNGASPDAGMEGEMATLLQNECMAGGASECDTAQAIGNG